MALTFEALAIGAVDLAMLRLMLRLENDGQSDHPAARITALIAGLLLLR